MRKADLNNTQVSDEFNEKIVFGRTFEKSAADEEINTSIQKKIGELTYVNNSHFRKKIPSDAEACNILVGGVDYLDKSTISFVRLKSAVVFENLTEVPVPTRFLFLLLGPASCHTEYYEIGRAMAAIMSDEIFQEVAYGAANSNHLLAGLEEILNASTLLLPGLWNPTTRIEPPLKTLRTDRSTLPITKAQEELEEEETRIRRESGLLRTGVLFGGLLNDINRKSPWYSSDFKDAFSVQCMASCIFLYFACLSPIITFGGLLSQVTGQNMAAMESLIAGFICGIVYGLFSGQPLTILASTGPVLVFETIIYDYCEEIGWDYMSFRFCIGTWIAVILMILVAVDASAFVCYITKFTEDNFTTLVAVIFIYKAVENVLFESDIPIRSAVYSNSSYQCLRLSTDSVEFNSSEAMNIARINETRCEEIEKTMPDGCSTHHHIPNVFLMSILLFLGTYVISIKLKNFRNSLFFSSKVRQIISDFAVTIAILSMTTLDSYIGIPTLKLVVPKKFEPTSSRRGWFIPPFKDNPFTSVLLAIPLALLGTILIFMDQQITAVIVNRKQHKLKKGCGYHLDLFVLSILIEICSFMGLPWFAAATVPSINHVNSLKLETESVAPGEKHSFLGVREQRVTHILIFLTIGLSVFLRPILGFIPMPVLYGVFLFMGVESLKGLELFDRILILFMPNKYQPDYIFLRQVPIERIHLFTAIQLACLGCLWAVKSFKSISILFPLMLVVMIAVRKFLDLIFTQRELTILDEFVPKIIDGEHKLKNKSLNAKISYYILGPKLISTSNNIEEVV